MFGHLRLSIALLSMSSTLLLDLVLLSSCLSFVLAQAPPLLLAASPPSLMYNVNCGGPANAELGWISDENFTTSGMAAGRFRREFRTDELFAFNTERRGLNMEALVYNFEAPNGLYEIHLLFTEAQRQYGFIGGRIMDVRVGSLIVLEKYDIFDAAAGTMGDGRGALNTSVVEEFTVDIVGDTGIDIVFEAVAGDAKVNGIAIYVLQHEKTSSPVPSVISSSEPSVSSSSSPSVFSSETPSTIRSSTPSLAPSAFWSESPSVVPSAAPSVLWSVAPSDSPSSVPSPGPSTSPSVSPSAVPSKASSVVPSVIPSLVPSGNPSEALSMSPSSVPSGAPSSEASVAPTVVSSDVPSTVPNSVSSVAPSIATSALPSDSPSPTRSVSPSASPSSVPSPGLSMSPSASPTVVPSKAPSVVPSFIPSLVPSGNPSEALSSSPSSEASVAPTVVSSDVPSTIPSSVLSVGPSAASSALPSDSPSPTRSVSPSTSLSSMPSPGPSTSPSDSPSEVPTKALSVAPSFIPSFAPSGNPSKEASWSPSSVPSVVPTSEASVAPSLFLSDSPSTTPTSVLSVAPSAAASAFPSDSPGPTILLSASPSSMPSEGPSKSPSDSPSVIPSEASSAVPSIVPSLVPSENPSKAPSSPPSSISSMVPSVFPSSHASVVPSSSPSVLPSVVSSGTPSTLRSAMPSVVPSAGSSEAPTTVPSAAPSVHPSVLPSASLSSVPSAEPSTATLSPTKTTSSSPSTLADEWVLVDTFTGSFEPRHEACFVMVNEKGYLIGGRGIDPVNVYDPRTQTWTEKQGLDLKIHHMQCVAVDNKIYLINAWTGGYPRERNLNRLYVYDTENDVWETKRALPTDRRRGSGAAVLRGREIFVSHGNRGGHGSHANSTGWFDKYNVDTDRWTTNLPDAPNKRDHTGGALVANGTLYCVGAGRDSGSREFFDNVVLPTDCFNFDTNEWEVHPDIPQGRAGSSYGQTCDGKLMVAGGEGFGQAWDNVDVYDGISWTSIDPLHEARHGSGLAVSCVCDQIHVASGSGAQGGRPELTNVETLSRGGILSACPV